MNKVDERYVVAKVKEEGFDYTFFHYSDFDDIEDDKFHRLRNAYLDARQELADYIGMDKGS